MALQIFYIAQLVILIYFCGYIGLKSEKKYVIFNIYFDGEVIALFCSSNCHLNRNSLYIHNV